MAGAYAVARKDVATALPGVAIAAALVPPLGVVGVGVASGNLRVAGGGTLLFMTNLIAIALAGAITFLLLGFRPGTRSSKELSLQRGLGTAVTLLVLVSIPLGVLFVQTLRASQMQKLIQTTLAAALEKNPGVQLVDPDLVEINEDALDAQGNPVTLVTVPLYVKGKIDPKLADQLRQTLGQAVDEPIQVRLVSYPVIEAGP